MAILQNVASMSRINMLLSLLFAESRGANTAWGKETGLMYCCQWWTVDLTAVDPMRGEEPRPCLCFWAFGYSKKIVEKDLPKQRNKSSEVHFIFLSQMAKLEFREDWRHYDLMYPYILMSPMVACRDIPTLIKCKFYATRVHKHLNQDLTWYVQKDLWILYWRMASE